MAEKYSTDMVPNCNKCDGPRIIVKKGKGTRYRCRKCENEYQRNHYAANTNAIRKRKAAHMRKARNSLLTREQYLNHGRKFWKSKGKEKRRSYLDRIRVENPWLWKTITVHSKFRGKNGAEILKAIWDKQRGLCGLTGKPLDFATAQLDHIVPRSRGGGNEPSNLRWTCKRANEMKRDLLDSELLELCNQVAEWIGNRILESLA